MFDNALQIRTGFALVIFIIYLYNRLVPYVQTHLIKSGRTLTSSISAGVEALGTNRKRPPAKYCRLNVWLFLVLPGKFRLFTYTEPAKRFCL